jgi:pSer/pThr/pTyr-binding forkhead associated (FHA) protein
VQIVIQHLTGSDAGRSDVFPLGSVRIGRDEACDVTLDLHRDLEVSSEHAELYLNPELGLCIRDLDSTNGTWVNGEKIEDTPIDAGAKIELGKGGVQLRLRLKKSLREWITRRNPAAPPKVVA